MPKSKALKATRFGMLPWLVLSVLVLLLDQVSKAWAQQAFALYQTWDVLPVFSFTLAYNTGAAFSFLAGAAGWQRWFFSSVAVAVSIILVGWLRKLERNERWLAIALSLVLGGALGNLYDRVVLGHVVDFILLHYNGWYFPAFNVADIAISLGAMMLIVDMFRPQKKSTVHTS